MAFETLVAVYDTAAHADAAVKALKAAGFHESDISVFDGARLKAGEAALRRTSRSRVSGIACSAPTSISTRPPSTARPFRTAAS